MYALKFVELYSLEGTICLRHSHESMQVLWSEPCDSLSGGCTLVISNRRILLCWLQAMSNFSTSRTTAYLASFEQDYTSVGAYGYVVPSTMFVPQVFL